MALSKETIKFLCRINMGNNYFKKPFIRTIITISIFFLFGILCLVGVYFLVFVNFASIVDMGLPVSFIGWLEVIAPAVILLSAASLSFIAGIGLLKRKRWPLKLFLIAVVVSMLAVLYFIRFL